MTGQPDAPVRPGTGAGRWLQRAAVVAGALVYSVLALGSGLDRSARSDPRVAAVVPEPFRANADRTLAQLALSANNFPGMRAPALASLKRDPMVPASSALYGWSLFAGGNDDEATAVFQLAGQLGWRDPLVQSYWFAAAMQQQDYPVAAMRLDALLRQAPGDPERDPAIYQLESVPAGRAALIDRLAERPDWLEHYASGRNPLPPQMMQARYETLMGVGKRGIRLGCEGVAGFVMRLVAMNMPDQAQALRSLHCPEAAGPGLLSDGRFTAARMDRPLTPFDWSFASDGAVNMALVDGEGGNGKDLRVANGAAVTRAFATQLVRLAPGRYRLAGRIAGDSSADMNHFGAGLTCGRGLREQIPAPAVASGRFVGTVTVPAGCAVAKLSLTLAPGPGFVTIGDLTLVRK